MVGNQKNNSVLTVEKNNDWYINCLDSCSFGIKYTCNGEVMKFDKLETVFVAIGMAGAVMVSMAFLLKFTGDMHKFDEQEKTKRMKIMVEYCQKQDLNVYATGSTIRCREK